MKKSITIKSLTLKWVFKHCKSNKWPFYLKALKVLLSFRISPSLSSWLSLFFKNGRRCRCVLFLLFNLFPQCQKSTTTNNDRCKDETIAASQSVKRYIWSARTTTCVSRRHTHFNGSSVDGLELVLLWRYLRMDLRCRSVNLDLLLALLKFMTLKVCSHTKVKANISRVCRLVRKH